MRAAGDRARGREAARRRGQPCTGYNNFPRRHTIPYTTYELIPTEKTANIFLLGDVTPLCGVTSDHVEGGFLPFLAFARVLRLGEHAR